MCPVAVLVLLSVEPATYALIRMRRSRDGKGTVLRLLQLAATREDPRLSGIFEESEVKRVDCVESVLGEGGSRFPFA